MGHDHTVDDGGTVANGVQIPLPEIENFEERIIEACARHLLWSTVVGDGESEDGYTIQTELQRKVRDQMLEVVKEQAREAAPEIAKLILAGDVQLTDEYGYNRGQTKTVAQLIADTVKESLRDGSSGRSGPSVLRKFIQDEVQGKLRGELAATLEEAKAPVLEAVRSEAVRVIEGAMQNALTVVAAGKAGRR